MTIKDYLMRKKPIIIAYVTALHKQGVGGKKAIKVRQRAENLSGLKKIQTLKRFEALDEIFSLNNDISGEYM